MNAGSEMDNDIDTVESCRPVGFAGYLDGKMPHIRREAGGGRAGGYRKLPYPLFMQPFDEGATDKAGRAGNEASHHLFPVLP